MRPVVRGPDDHVLRRAEWDVVGTACFPFVRAVGEMSWVLRNPPGADELFGYEAAINDFAPRYLLVENSWCMPALERWVSGADSVGLCEHRGQGGAE